MNRGPKPVSYLILLLLLIPSAAYLWHNSDLPQFGDLHDDSIYFVSAKSLADGGGYRLESLPGEPPHTKFPPLYPLLLSIAWRIDPHFPSNLHVAAWLSWIAFPALLIQSLWLFPRLGLTGWRVWVLMSIQAISPFLILFSSTLVSEIPFTALMVAALLVSEKAADEDGWTMAAFAGLVAGLSYLTRTAGIAFLAAGPLYFLWRKQRDKAIAFAAAMFPFVAGWMLFTKLRHTPTTDPSLVYYLDYFRYQLNSVQLHDLHIYVWKNIDGFLWGMGGLVLPKIGDSLFLKILSEVIAVAMISGVVRLVRQKHAVLYALFAAFSILMLIPWNSPPNERLVLPLFPLGLAGLIVEMEHFAGLLRAGMRHKDRSQRVVAGGLLAGVSLVFVAAFGLQVYFDAAMMPEDAQAHRQRNADRIAAFNWMKANLPPDSGVMGAEDVQIYLNTGFHAMRRLLPTRLVYREDHPETVKFMTEIRPFAKEHGFDYFLFAGVDSRQGVDDDDSKAIEKAIRSSPELHPLFTKGDVTVYNFTARDLSAAYTTAPASTITKPGQVLAGR